MRCASDARGPASWGFRASGATKPSPSGAGAEHGDVALAEAVGPVDDRSVLVPHRRETAPVSAELGGQHLSQLLVLIDVVVALGRDPQETVGGFGPGEDGNFDVVVVTQGDGERVEDVV